MQWYSPLFRHKTCLRWQPLPALATAKTVSVSDVLMDALLGLAIDGVGSLVEQTVKDLAQQAAGSILSTNLAFSLLPLSDEGAAMSANALTQALANMASSPNVSGAAFAAYSQGVRSAIEVGSQKLGTSLSGLTKAALQPSKRNLNIAGSDEPRTAITRVVQSYVAAHRLALRTECISLEGFIRSQGSLTTDQLTSLSSSFVIEKSPDDLDSLRESFSLMYEAIIWGKIYNLDQMQMQGNKVPTAINTNTGGAIANVPDVITHYWWVRFASLTNLSSMTQGSVADSQMGPYNQSLSVLRVLIPMAQQLDQTITQLQSQTNDVMISVNPQ